MKPIISFTGHRDKLTTKDQLDIIYFFYSSYIWCHGGAEGFDTQVHDYCKERGVEQLIIKPDYTKYSSKFAPIARDYLIVQKGNLLVALYDGRTFGGTYRTVEYAKLIGKKIIYLEVE